MTSEKVILEYKGNIDFDTLQSLLNDLKHKLLLIPDITTLTKKRVFNVTVECIENIYKHSNSKKNEILFKITYANKTFTIISENHIKFEDINQIKEKIDTINSLDREGLKNLYNKIITNTKISERGGAGLGFIDMAIKTCNKIGYEFEKIDDNTYKFKEILIINDKQ